MPPRTRRSLTALAAGALLLAGCSTEADGTAEPHDQGNHHQQRPDLPHSGAPAVDEPITETSQWENDPCSVLTDEQIADTGVDPADANHDPEARGGTTCNWRTESRDESFSITFNTANPDGISGEYARKQRGDRPYFEEIEPAAGHPAVAGDGTDDGPERGYCNVSVGLRDDLAIVLGMTASFEDSLFHDDPCGAAHELAELAVHTMKGDA